MTPEFYAIIATGIALAGLILNNQRATAELRKELKALGERVNLDIAELREQMHHGVAELREQVHREIAALDEKLSRRIAALDEKLSRDIAALGERLARLEGFMEGIRGAIAGKAA